MNTREEIQQAIRASNAADLLRVISDCMNELEHLGAGLTLREYGHFGELDSQWGHVTVLDGVWQAVFYNAVAERIAERTKGGAS